MNTESSQATGWKKYWRGAVPLGIAALTLAGGAIGLAQVRPGQGAGQRPSPEILFRQFDTNRDGKLSSQEFGGIARLSPRLRDNPEQAEGVFQQADVNSDGSMSLEEFRTFSDLAARAQARPGASAGEQMRQRLDAGYAALDTNKNGKLDRTEFERIGQFVVQLQNNPTATQSLFNELDKNTDEAVTLEEYRGLAALAQRNAPRRPAATPKPAVAERAPTSEELEFFEKKIRPVLAKSCYSCHSADAEKIKGGLVLDTREGIRKGGDTGPSVVPGDVEHSLLIKAIRYDDDELQMPPKKDGGKLPSDVIADFEQWVRMGAPDPREGKASVAKAVSIEKGREHWAFQLPKKAAAPAVKDANWARSDIDRYVLSALEAKNLKPVGDADARTLLRRLYFDLIGLPPTPEEVEAFVQEYDAASASGNTDSAVAKVVDRLLASPQFGERWGRHWLDVARYAESSGKENNIVYPHAWRYRDYVIASLNADKPYDQFLKEQIAGDLMPAKNDTQKAEQLVATGFLAIGPKSHNTRDQRQFLLDLADEQIDAMSQGMLGLTVACARCHDHKFDPIPQKDYYALAGIFLSTETRFGTPRFIQNNQATPLLALPEKAEVTDAPPMSPMQMTALQRRLDQSKQDRDNILAEAREKGDRGAFANPRLIGTGIQIAIAEKILGRYDEKGNPARFAMGVQDRANARDAQILLRGELDKPSDTVPRGFVQVVSTKPAKPVSRGSGRLELAEWVASPDNPLTARVMANRVWLHLFGNGLVPTPDNFGTTGQKPTHPELLDHLALRLVDNGWSVKKLVREIVLSRTYQLASDYNASNYAVDPDNTWLWRMSKRRLDAESIRDAMLAVAGRLDLTPPKGSPVAASEGPVQQLLRPIPGMGGGPVRFGPKGGPGPGGMGGDGANLLTMDRPVRSVYLPIVRDQVPEVLDVFDFAEPSLVVGERDDTSVPSQALYLMNNATVQRLAEAMADRMLAKNLRGAELGKAAFYTAYSRPPTDGELKATLEFFDRFAATEGKGYSSKDRFGRASLVAFCQALFGSAEFRYLN
ncbi:MAG: DUF1553 domain-containing protein [Verrucomicrobiota bacterium]